MEKPLRTVIEEALREDIGSNHPSFGRLADKLVSVSIAYAADCAKRVRERERMLRSQ